MTAKKESTKEIVECFKFLNNYNTTNIKFEEIIEKDCNISQDGIRSWKRRNHIPDAYVNDFCKTVFKLLGDEDLICFAHDIFWLEASLGKVSKRWEFDSKAIIGETASFDKKKFKSFFKYFLVNTKAESDMEVEYKKTKSYLPIHINLSENTTGILETKLKKAYHYDEEYKLKLENKKQFFLDSSITKEIVEFAIKKGKYPYRIEIYNSGIHMFYFDKDFPIEIYNFLENGLPNFDNDESNIFAEILNQKLDNNYHVELGSLPNMTLKPTRTF